MLFHEGRAFVFLPRSKKPIDIALTPFKVNCISQFGFYCNNKTTWPENAWEGKSLFGLYILITVHH